MKINKKKKQKILKNKKNKKLKMYTYKMSNK